MRNFLLILFTIFSCVVYAQNPPKIIKGTVFIDSIPTQDVHIINKKLAIGAISNENGQFEILVEENNILLISHLNLEYKEITVNKENIKAKNIVIYVDSKTHMLDDAPVVNAETLKLPYANVKPKDDKTVKIESGVTIGLSGLVNALNGNNKKKKLLKKLKIEDQNIANIRKHYTDGFFIRQLKIKEEHINSFLESCISKGIINLYRKDKILELTSVLIENSKHSPYLLENELIRLTQK